MIVISTLYVDFAPNFLHGRPMLLSDDDDDDDDVTVCVI